MKTFFIFLFSFLLFTTIVAIFKIIKRNTPIKTVYIREKPLGKAICVKQQNSKNKKLLKENKMKKRSLIIVGALFLALTLSGCKQNVPVETESVTVEESEELTIEEKLIKLIEEAEYPKNLHFDYNWIDTYRDKITTLNIVGDVELDQTGNIKNSVTKAETKDGVIKTKILNNAISQKNSKTDKDFISLGKYNSFTSEQQKPNYKENRLETLNFLKENKDNIEVEELENSYKVIAKNINTIDNLRKSLNTAFPLDVRAPEQNLELKVSKEGYIEKIYLKVSDTKTGTFKREVKLEFFDFNEPINLK